MSSIVMEPDVRPEVRPDEEPPAAAAGDAEALSAMIDAVRGADALIARAVLLAGRLAGSGASEREEGLPLEQHLGLSARLTGADRRMLVAAGEVLRDLPCVAGLFSRSELSWGQVRAVVHAAKHLHKAERAELDARMAATVAERGGVDGFDPDQLLWAIQAAVDELRDPRVVERRERDLARHNFLAVQARLDGGMSLYGEFDPLAGAAVVNALDAAGGRPGPDPATDDPEAADADDRADGDAADAEHPWNAATTVARRRAAALERICADWLGGGQGRPARPLFVVHADLAQASANAAGTVELAVRGPLPTVSAATLERLVTDADLRAVLFDRARPLGVSAKVNAADIAARARTAVAARDRGCRFPGSQDPAAHCDLHHIRERHLGGDHDPDNLVMLSRRHHTLVHRHGWRLTLNPHTGELTIQRGNRTWRSLPNGTPLARAPDPPPKE